jgi:hypothetical protein
MMLCRQNVNKNGLQPRSLGRRLMQQQTEITAIGETAKKDKPEAVIQGLISATISRAWRETAACVAVAASFTWILSGTSSASPAYYGCLLILVSTGFISGIVWSFRLGYSLLESHPASDRGFWLTAFQTQARLLRLTPLWYCGPICAGLILCTWSARIDPGLEWIRVSVQLTIMALFTWVIWLNRNAASQLDGQAELLVHPDHA